MASVLVAYGTGEGQTATIADRVAETLATRGHAAETVDLDETTADPAAFDAVLVGTSIHAGAPQAAAVEFVQAHRDALSARPSGFFQVSLSAALDDADARAQAAGYVEKFVEQTGFHPDRIGQFGGALRYSAYGFLKRLLIKQIAKRTTGDTDTSQDYEYTDWDEVEAFAADFAAFLEGRLGAVPPAQGG